MAAEPKTAEEKARDKAKDDVYAFDEDFKQRHLWKVGVADRAEKRITERRLLGGALRAVATTARRIAHHRAPCPLLGDAERGEVWVMDADGGNAVAAHEEHGAGKRRRAVARRDAGAVRVRLERGVRDLLQPKLFVVPAAGGAARLWRGLRRRRRGAAWSKDGASIYFIANLGVHSELFVDRGDRRTPRR